MSNRFLEYGYHQSHSTKGVIIKPYYYNHENMIEKLSKGNFQSKSYFSNNTMEKMMKTIKVDELITKWDEDD